MTIHRFRRRNPVDDVIAKVLGARFLTSRSNTRKGFVNRIV